MKHLQSVLPKMEMQGNKTLFSLQAGPFHTGTGNFSPWDSRSSEL